MIAEHDPGDEHVDKDPRTGWRYFSGPSVSWHFVAGDTDPVPPDHDGGDEDDLHRWRPIPPAGWMLLVPEPGAIKPRPPP